MDPVGDSASPFTPPDTGSTPTLLIALALTVLIVAGLWLSNGRNSRPVEEPPATGSTLAPATAAIPQPPGQSVRPPPLEVPSPVAAPRPAWSRCDVGGKVVYSDADCPANAVKSTADNTQAALSTLPTAPNRPGDGVTTIYRCKSYSGVVFWSSKHCHEQKALVERMVSVPSGLRFQDQVAEATRLIPGERVGPPAVVNRAIAVPNEKELECKVLFERIRRIDAAARQPQSGPGQDRLRDQRRAARDRQFALRC